MSPSPPHTAFVHAMVDRFTTGPSIDVAQAWAEISSTARENAAAPAETAGPPPPLPLETVLQVVNAVRELHHPEPHVEWYGATSDTAAAPPPFLRPRSELESARRLVALIRHVRRTQPSMDPAWALALDAEEATLRAQLVSEGTSPLRVQAAMWLTRNVDKHARRSPDSVLTPWASARAARVWMQVVRSERFADERSTREVVRCLTGSSDARLGLRHPQAAEVHGLHLRAARTLSELRARCRPRDRTVVEDAVEALRPVLLRTVAKLPATRLLDRIGLAALLALSARHRRTRLRHAWEALALTVRLGASHDIDLETLEALIRYGGRPPCEVVAWLRQAIGAPSQARVVLSKHMQSVLLWVLVPMCRQLAGRLPEVWRGLGRLPTLPKAAEEPWREWDLDLARADVERRDGLERVVSLLQLGRMLGQEGRPADTIRVCDDAQAALEALRGQLDLRVFALAAWRILHDRGMHHRFERATDRARADLEGAAAVALDGGLYQEAAQAISGLASIWGQAGRSDLQRDARGLARELAGLAVAGGRASAVWTWTGHPPPSPHVPRSLASINLQAKVLKDRCATWRGMVKSPGKGGIAQATAWLADRAAGLSSLVDWTARVGSPSAEHAADLAGRTARRALRTLDGPRGVDRPEVIFPVIQALAETAGRLAVPRQQDQVARLHEEVRRRTQALVGAGPPVPDMRQLTYWCDEAFHDGGPPVQRAEVLISVAAVALQEYRRHSGRVRGARRRMGLARSWYGVAHEAAERLQGLADDHDGQPWWMGSGVETSVVETLCLARPPRALHPSDHAVAVADLRALQLELRIQARRRRGDDAMARRDNRLIDAGVVGATRDLEWVEPERVQRWLDFAKAIDLAVECVDPTDDPDDAPSDPAAGAGLGTLPPEPREIFPRSVQSTDESVPPPDHVPGSVILELFTAPTVGYPPPWDVLCVATVVEQREDGSFRRAEHQVFATHRRGGAAHVGKACRTIRDDLIACQLAAIEQVWEERSADAQSGLGQLGARVFSAELVAWLQARSDQVAHVYLCPHGPLHHVPLHLAELPGLGPLVEWRPCSMVPKGHLLGHLLRTPPHDPFAGAPLRVAVDTTEGGGQSSLELGPADAWHHLVGIDPPLVEPVCGRSSEAVLGELASAGGGGFLCHGLVDLRRDHVWRSRLLLPHGARVTIRDLERTPHPLEGAEFVLMACNAAALRHDPSDANAGITQALLRRRVRTVLAPQVPIRVDLARDTIEAYCSARRAGSRPAVAFRETLEQLHGVKGYTWGHLASLALYGVG